MIEAIRDGVGSAKLSHDVQVGLMLWICSWLMRDCKEVSAGAIGVIRRQRRAAQGFYVGSA